jgi:hypothetical protein
MELRAGMHPSQLMDYSTRRASHALHESIGRYVGIYSANAEVPIDDQAQIEEIVPALGFILVDEACA